MSAPTLPSVLRHLFRLFTSCGVLAALWLAIGVAGMAQAASAAPMPPVAPAAALAAPVAEPVLGPVSGALIASATPAPAPAGALHAAVVPDEAAQPGAALDGEQEQRLEAAPAGPRLPTWGGSWQRPAPAALHRGPALRGLLRPPDA